MAFTSNTYHEYCKGEGIESILITTGIIRGNEQEERVNKGNSTIISLLT